MSKDSHLRGVCRSVESTYFLKSCLRDKDKLGATNMNGLNTKEMRLLMSRKISVQEFQKRTMKWSQKIWSSPKNLIPVIIGN